jgi:hypothetical protein
MSTTSQENLMFVRFPGRSAHDHQKLAAVHSFTGQISKLHGRAQLFVAVAFIKGISSTLMSIHFW